MENKIYLITGGIIILSLIIIYIIICAIHYNNSVCFEKKSFIYYLFDVFDSNSCVHETDPNPPPPPSKSSTKSFDPLSFIEKKEVFHIGNQDYTYEQSKCKCESYGARLAKKSEVIDSYNNGANWCTYGWSENQSAYYPVQQCDWDEMNRKNESLPHNMKQFCGMPGVNGGYFANPNLKFGVNCYGVKPKGNINKEKKPFCPPMNFCKLEQNFEASHKLDTDEITGFNTDNWNMP